jgi:hypothetical protein
MSQMIIANRLRDGRVVFLGAEDRWEAAIESGALVEADEDTARLLAIATRHEADGLVVDPQPIEVVVEEGKRRPTAIREAIRAFGPTVRTDLTVG